MANRFWVGGAGTWDQSGTSHWSTTTGGSSGAAVPTAADDVFLDANSGAVNVTFGVSGPCRSLTCTGFTGTLTHGTANILTIGDASGGALTLVAGMTYTLSNAATSAITFAATTDNSTAGWAVTTAGKTLGNVVFNGVGGKWVLQDSLTCTGGQVSVINGAFFANGQAITCTQFNGNGAVTRTIDLTNTTVTITGTGGLNMGNSATGLTLVRTGSTLVLTNANPTFTGGPNTWNNVTFSGTGGTITTSQNYTIAGTLSIAAPETISFFHGGTYTLANLASGTAGNLVTYKTDTGASAATIACANAVSIDYVSVKDITASGNTPFIAGSHSTNVSGNTNWTFRTGGRGARSSGAPAMLLQGDVWLP